MSSQWQSPGGFNKAAYEQIKQQRNFVPAYAPGEPSKLPVQRGEMLQQRQAIELAPSVFTTQQVSTNHVDRARGFTIVSIPLAAGVGFGGLLLAVGLFAVPLFSMAALLTLFLAFLGTWLAAFLWYQSASPDGIGLWTVLLHSRLLSREPKARLRRMEDGS